MKDILGQSELEQLSAWLDGELTGQDAEQVEQLVRLSPKWEQALRGLKALDAALDHLPAPQTLPGLADRVIANIRAQQRPPTGRLHLARWLVPASAAAAIVLAVVLWQVGRPGPATPEDPPAALVNTLLNDVPAEDRFIVEHLEFFRDYELCGVMAANERVLDTQTLAALDQLESPGS